ncbi:MAG TPA: hypothetical protein VGQ78_10755 [Vicinamibacteria bacterium]|nr:hypothetical protein [Vicinamibacteria bacterium]
MKQFLAVDRILEVGDDTLVATKGFSGRERYFEVHLPPNNPVVPGTYLLEGLCDCVRWLTELRSDFARTATLRGLGNGKFTRMVRPGEVVTLKVVRESVDDGRETFTGECRVGREAVGSADLTVEVVAVADALYARTRAETVRYLRTEAQP